MDKFEEEKTEVRTRGEPERQNGANESPPKSPKKRSKEWEMNTIRDSKTAKEKGRNGGVKSGEVRRAKRDARESVQYFLGRMTKMENVKLNLRELGVEEHEFSNMMALQGKLWTMAMAGNLDAYLTLMRMGGYEPEEVRKERESLSADRRRELELEAKVMALGRGDNASLAVNLQDEDGANDVVIYMPEIETEENCELPPDSHSPEESTV